MAVARGRATAHHGPVAKTLHLVARLVLAVGLVLAAGCKSTPRPAPDRLASVLIESRGADQIQLVTMAVFREAGWRAISPAGDQMVFERKASSLDTVFYGDWLGGVVWLRAKVELRVLDMRRIILAGDVYRVIDKGNRHFEEEKKVKKGGGDELQKLLDQAAARLASAPPAR